jgi:hypothetical protein
MDRQQISWLIIRAFGVYLLVQAFILLPEVLAAFFTARYYSNILSSMGSESSVGSSYRVATSMYRTLAVAPLLRIVLYSAVGIYMLRGGAFLVRLLQHVPDRSTDTGAQPDTRANLTEQEARNMSVKERLSAAGLFREFVDAVERRDVPELQRILRQTYLPPDSIQAVIEEVLGTPGDAQQIVGREPR